MHDDELVIEPGVEIISNNDSQIIVYGRLSAIGTADSRIIFNSDNSWKGIRITESQQENIISNCEISKADYSAIVANVNTSLDILDNIIYENSSLSLGAAIEIDSSDDVNIIRNIICNNSSQNSTGGIECISSSPTISNNIIVNNNGSYSGAISLKNESAPILENNTITNNDAANGAILVFNSSPIIINSIILNDEALINMINGSVDISYSCLSETYTGTGNICSDPLFVQPTLGNGTTYNGLEANWQLQQNSPCIDSGNPDPCYNDPDGSRNDIGAYGGPNGMQPTEVDNEVISISDNTLNVYPNPFNPNTTISFSLTTELTENTEICIYNLKGQKVIHFSPSLCHPEPVEGRGEIQVIWNGTDQNKQPVASGIYFVRLKSGSVSLSKKVLLLK
jgi:hypothetical protein